MPEAIAILQARIVYLLYRIDHASVEILLDIYSSSAKQTFSFVGIRTNSKTEKTENKVIDQFLTFKFQPKSGSSNKQSKKTFIVSCLKNSLSFIEIVMVDRFNGKKDDKNTNKEQIFRLSQNDTLRIIDDDEPEIGLISIDKLYFSDEYMKVTSIRSAFKKNIDSAFSLAFSNAAFNSFDAIPNFIKVKPKEKQENKVKESKAFSRI